RRIAEGVAGGLAVRAAGGLQLLAGGTVLVPSCWELAVEPYFGKPRFAIRDEATADRPGQADPFVATRGEDPLSLIIAALRLADFFRHVGQIDNAVGIELGPAADHHHDVGPGPRLDGRGCPRLDIVGVDGFEGELDAQRLLAFLGDLALQD